MFYHMLVGEPPYRSDEFESLLKQQTSLEDGWQHTDNL